MTIDLAAVAADDQLLDRIHPHITSYDQYPLSPENTAELDQEIVRLFGGSPLTGGAR